MTLTKAGVMLPEGKPEPVTLINVTPGSPALGAVTGLKVIEMPGEVEEVSARTNGTSSKKRRELETCLSERIG
jgi:hypothetical protein